MTPRNLLPRDDDIAELDRIIDADAKRARSYTGSTQAHMRDCLAKFEGFLESLGVEGGVEELAGLVDRNDTGAPILPSPLVAAFQVACCETQKPSTAVGTAGTAVSALAVRGWDTTVAAEARRKGLSRTIRLNAEHRSPDELVAARRRARPLLPEDARSLLATLDEIEANPGATVSLWIALWRAIICVGWFCGLRTAELILLRWSWVQFVTVDDEDALLIELPAGLKYSDEPRSILVTATGNPLCAVAAMAAWRTAAEAAGMPRGADDPVFVRVRRRDVTIEQSPRGPGRGKRKGLTIADIPPLAADIDHDTSYKGFADLNPRAPETALERVFDDARVNVGELSAASGYVLCWRCARCGWRTTGPVSARIGCNSCGPVRDDLNVCAPSDVQYYDPVDAFLSDRTWNADRPADERHAVAVSNATRGMREDWRKLCKAAGFKERSDLERPSAYAMRRGTATTMHLAGATIWEIQQVLGHDSPTTTSIYISNADVDGEDVAGILDEGPLPQPNVPEGLLGLNNAGLGRRRQTPGCEIEHDGARCEREFLTSASIDGRRLGMCNAHYQRFYRGLRGPKLTTPIKSRDGSTGPGTAEE